MTSIRPHPVPDRLTGRAPVTNRGRIRGTALGGHFYGVLRVAALIVGSLMLAVTAAGQVATPAAEASKDAPKEMIRDGYVIHQTVDLGGHIASHEGSRPMYDTLVNLQSGPRVLNHSLEMHAIGKTKYPFFDTLVTNSSGYGGDPNNFTMFRMSKGKLYDFQGLFRRDRQFFDYNLFDNPLVPLGVSSNGYTYPQVLHSPHLFNTVRRMTDVDVTLFPLSRVSTRFGYSKNISQGPSYSSVHHGQEALLFQNWRNSTDSLYGAVDFKLSPRTSVTFEEYITHYKGDTTENITALNLQLPDGTRVSQGFDVVNAPNCTGPAILDNTTNPPTANPTCETYVNYYRYAPTRWLSPTEEFRFQSASLTNVRVNGRIRYTGTSMKLPVYTEYFNGLERGLRIAATSGYGKAQRINVSADFGVVWQLAKKWSLSEQFDFWNFREPADTNTSEIDTTGADLASPLDPGPVTTVTAAHNYLSMKTITNTVTVGWEASPRATVHVGYRSRARTIGFAMPLPTDFLVNGTAYTLPLHENGGLLALGLRPTREWRINANVEMAYANKTYVQTSPRTLKHYQFRTTYRPKAWATLSGTFNDLERRNNELLVNYRDSSRSISAAASLMPSARYGVDMSYGYMDVFSNSILCYAPDPTYAGPGAGAAPADCGTNTALGSGYYDAPTQFGSLGVTLTPVKKVRTAFGYRMSAVDGRTAFLNPRQVPGSLQSQYSSPYANLALTIARGWAWKGDWNYYGYGEGSPIGPSAGRSFHGNVYTLAVHHEF